jgi:hypothetical protein
VNTVDVPVDEDSFFPLSVIRMVFGYTPAGKMMSSIGVSKEEYRA